MISKTGLSGSSGLFRQSFIVLLSINKQENIEIYPLFENEIREVVLKSGNMVSTGALASRGLWDIDFLITTQKGRPVAMLRSFDDDSLVQTTDRFNPTPTFK